MAPQSPTTTRRRAKTARTEPSSPAPVADTLVPKHVRFGENAWERADGRAAADGRTLIDVLRAFVAKYGNGELPAP